MNINQFDPLNYNDIVINKLTKEDKAYIKELVKQPVSENFKLYTMIHFFTNIITTDVSMEHFNKIIDDPNSELNDVKKLLRNILEEAKEKDYNKVLRNMINNAEVKEYYKSKLTTEQIKETFMILLERWSKDFNNMDKE